MKGNGKAVPFHFRGGLQAAARIICPPMAGKFHTCGLRGIFSDALVVRKNDSNLFAAVRGGKVCDAEKETALAVSFFFCFAARDGKKQKSLNI